MGYPPKTLLVCTTIQRMILEGVQFLSYACFTQQFVALRGGLNLLVGKNNAGKTALLKGVAALAAIPLSNWSRPTPVTQEFISSLEAYARKDGSEPRYEIEIIFRMEDTDDQAPLRTLGAHFWELVRQSEVRAAYRFWCLPQRNEHQIIFNSCDLRFPGYPSLPILISSSQGLQIPNYQALEPGGKLPVPALTRAINPGGQQISGPDNMVRWVPLPAVEGYFDGLAPFANTRYVSPHRVVTPWIEIHTADVLPENADNLPVFLQTLHGRNRKAFQQIENLVISIFPEFTAVNPATERNQVRITLSRRDVDKDIPLTHCGTGVEQILAIATFAITASKGSLLLIDEPHSFLHPTAERQLIEFLKADQNHRFIISTHSAVFINSIEADRITQVEAPGKGYSSADQGVNLSRILLDLGYRNSDILFHDALVIVEGKTDKAILPALLALAGVSSDRLARVGFPTLEGVPEKLRAIQTAILKYERLIDALSQSDTPRIYLLDGDRSNEDLNVLSSMKNANNGSSIPVKFLPRTEIENYLLVPHAIEKAILEEAELAGTIIDTTAHDIDGRIADLLKQNDLQLFPRGKSGDPIKQVKGSTLLRRLYESFGNLVYDKEHSGTLIAHHLRAQDQPMVAEVRELLRDLFP
jgi:ABC-type transport system involved in cytochrome c biogenesis ATPase subunit